MKLRAALILTILLTGVAAALALRSGQPPPSVLAQSADRPVTVTAAPVVYVVMFDRIEALGTVFANESAAISATVTERVVALHFEDNQFVRKGDPIATLSQQEVQAARDAAVEQLTEHQRELNRLESLLQNQSVSRQAYDQRKTLLRITQQRIKELEARLQDRSIRAPFSGVLGLRKISVGALVQPGDLITTIDDVSRIKLDFAVPETYIPLLAPGAAVSATSRILGGRTFEGTVAGIDTRVDPATRSVVVRALVPNPDRALKPGMLLTVTLLKNERRSLVVPEEAIVPFQRRTFVWVVDPGASASVERREVTTGGRRPGVVEILNGLAQGERVVVRGTDQLRPGSRVVVMQTEPLPPGPAAAL
ncbi:MAG: efflux RND transporter periplasmic adaptor subunit [Desulfobacterales bacterium]|nr:efflux RND transporter periplasmic adaptor subunit [Desulfobacterales bacterium]